ncbi:RICIN domain-containing protein [Inquilinus sp. NPDC058860]|uniref:RICIN domain-containing protein n=1 Tax=Inquilinus sp. NPDC058860 TaxID=3346652 RepID=UPI0036952291
MATQPSTGRPRLRAEISQQGFGMQFLALEMENRTMLRTIAASTVLFLLTLQAAQADTTFRLVSQVSGKCMRLQAADQNDGGGLTMRDCKNFPDFFMTGEVSTTQLIFQLNSSRFVCVFSNDAPVIEPSGRLDKVQTRNCGALVGSIWKFRGEDESGFRQLEKMQANGIDPTNFCAQENSETSEIELDVCQPTPEQNWKLERISFPPER